MPDTIYLFMVEYWVRALVSNRLYPTINATGMELEDDMKVQTLFRTIFTLSSFLLSRSITLHESKFIRQLHLISAIFVNAFRPPYANL